MNMRRVDKLVPWQPNKPLYSLWLELHLQQLGSPSSVFSQEREVNAAKICIAERTVNRFLTKMVSQPKD